MTFWGATFVGKALVKNTIQCMLIVVMFSEGVLDRILGILSDKIPILHSVVQGAINSQVRKFGGGNGNSTAGNVSNETNVSGLGNAFMLLSLYAGFH
jgi:hypothetical protein